MYTIPTCRNRTQLWVGGLRRGVIALGVTALVAASSDANTAPDELTLGVKAEVGRHASLQVVSQPALITITGADLARGYVDVPESSQVIIRSNSPDGFMVELVSQAEFVQSTLVRGLDTEVQWGAGGGAVAQRPAGRGMHSQTLALGYRFTLAPEARAGVYPWPVRLAVSPR